MSEPQAWFCPSCQKHHAPHVETCPGGGLTVVLPQSQPTYWSPRQPCTGVCGCGPDCPNRRLSMIYPTVTTAIGIGPAAGDVEVRGAH